MRVRVCKYACESTLSIYREHVLSIECASMHVRVHCLIHVKEEEDACESTLSALHGLQECLGAFEGE